MYHLKLIDHVKNWDCLKKRFLVDVKAKIFSIGDQKSGHGDWQAKAWRRFLGARRPSAYQEALEVISVGSWRHCNPSLTRGCLWNVQNIFKDILVNTHWLLNPITRVFHYFLLFFPNYSNTTYTRALKLLPISNFIV